MRHTIFLSTCAVLAVTVNVVTLVGGYRVPQDSGPKTGDFEELYRLYEEIYDGSVELEPEETHERLVRMSELEADLKTADSHFWLERCEPDEKGCDFKRFDLTWFDIGEFSETNLQPYLEYCINKQYVVCRERLSTNLREAVKRLNEDDKKDMDLIDQCFLPGQPEIAKTHAIETMELEHELEAVRKFHEAKSNSSEPAAPLLVLDWNHIKPIYSICKRVADTLMQAWHPYRFFDLHLETVKLFDEFELEWVPKVNLCRMIYFAGNHLELTSRLKDADRLL